MVEGPSPSRPLRLIEGGSGCRPGCCAEMTIASQPPPANNRTSDGDGVRSDSGANINRARGSLGGRGKRRKEGRAEMGTHRRDEVGWMVCTVRERGMKAKIRGRRSDHERNRREAGSK